MQALWRLEVAEAVTGVRVPLSQRHVRDRLYVENSPGGWPGGPSWRPSPRAFRQKSKSPQRMRPVCYLDFFDS